MWDWILFHLSDEVLVKRPVGSADCVLYEGIDGAGDDVELRQHCCRALASDFERASAFDVGLGGLGKQENGNALDYGVTVPTFADEAGFVVSERKAVAWADQEP
jgi:hypothetical protein